MKRKAGWSEEEEDELVRRFLFGDRIYDIAEDLKRSYGGTQSKILELRRKGRLIPQRQRGRKSKKDVVKTELRPVVRREVEVEIDERIKDRKCLMCGFDFESHGPGNRVCKKCKTTAVYQSTSSFEE